MQSKTEVVFNQNQLVVEIQETCAPRQRALLSLLTICHKHDLAATELVASFAEDLPRTPLEGRRKTRRFYWSRTHDFSDELKQLRAIPDALQKFPGLLPGTAELALQLEQAAGTLDEFTDAWLNRPPDYVFEATQNDSFVGRMFPLFLKTNVILLLSIFVLIKVFPEFQSMLEEFGVEPTPVFNYAAMIFDALARFWFVPVLLILIAIPFGFPALSSYFKRWNPFVWRQPIVPSSVSTRQALAMVTAYGKSISPEALTGFWKLRSSMDFDDAGAETTKDLTFDWRKLAARKIISATEAQALEMARSSAAQAWLLRKSAITQNHRIKSRGMLFTRVIVTAVNVILGAMILLLALSILSTLIGIMSHLK